MDAFNLTNVLLGVIVLLLWGVVSKLDVLLKKLENIAYILVNSNDRFN